jgi:LmbE family N-acetylglucosaminyl deacetylase
MLRIIAIVAHPDDAEFYAGGLAARYARAGHAVKFVSLTSGDAGHHEQGGVELAARRRAEAGEVARRLGIEYAVLGHHDGELLPTLEARRQVIGLIREWNADLVLSSRPNDYHPDHRSAGVLVQDAAYMVTVPNVVPDTPALRRNPVFACFADRFTRPQPFRADVVVAIDEVLDLKFDALDAHVSQVYEWLPWQRGLLDQVPADPVGRRRWLQQELPRLDPEYAFEVQPGWRQALSRWYGERAGAVRHAEAFEITELGHQPSDRETRELFPFFQTSADGAAATRA